MYVRRIASMTTIPVRAAAAFAFLLSLGTATVASAATGTLTPTSPACTIAAGASSCNVTLTWTTTNPIGTSAITSNYPSANTTVATGNSGSVSASVPYNSRTFYLYNNGVLLVTPTVTSSCASGSSWNGSTCQGAPTGTLTPTSPSCTIAAGASSCNVTLSWTTTNPVGTSAVTSNYPSANTTVATGNSGSVSASVPYNSRTFYLYNNGVLLVTRTAASSCASGSSWNGSTCQAAPSGTLTPTSPSCTIAAGSSSCNVTLSWTTTNPIGTSAVTSNYPSANTTVATGNSGSVSASVPYNSRTFYLYNNGQLLVTRTAASSCASGSSWNGSTCQAATSGTLTPTSPSCTIAAGASSCNVTLSWTTTNPIGTSAVTSDYPSANTTVATGNSGSTSAAVPYSNRTFYLYNNGQLLVTRTAASSCASGSSWNGSTCQAQTSGTLTPASPSCTIAAGASSCNVTLTWTTTNPVGTSSVTSNYPSANTTVATGNSGSTSAAVPYNSRTFYLYNNTQLLATSAASSSCISGTTWNGSTCQAPTTMSGTLTPASPSCTIAAGASSCNVTLTWSTTNPVGTSSVTSNYPSANTTVATGNSGSTSAAVPYNTRTFYLYNNTQLLDTSVASSSCISGTTWNGSTCAAPTLLSGTLTPASPSCTIAAGASSCNVTLTWTTTNPVGTSSVTSNYPSANTTVATGNSGSTSAAVPYNSRTFYLYNNTQLLATSVASSSCTSGTTWNGSTCAAPTSLSGTLTPASPSCTIAAGASSCNVTLTWTTTNPVGTSSVTSNYPSANTTVATGNSGSTSAAVPYNTRTFYLYNNTQLLATSVASSSCTSGTTWNGSTCAASTSLSGTLTPASPSCTIAAGASSCNVTLTWTTTNPVGTSSVTSNYPSANTTVATGNSGSTSAAVPYDTRTFYLYNNAQLLATSVASSSCTSGTTWNGSTCAASTSLSGTLTPASPSCTIAAGASSCNVTLTWTTTNPVGTSSVTSNYPSANTTVATGNSGSTSAAVPYNTRTFYLYNNAQLLATSVASSSCTAGTSWNGSTCAASTSMSGTLTPASPSCTIAAGASSCNVTLTWTTTNPVGTSSVTSNYPSANTTVATGNSGSTSVAVPYNARTFFLYNDAQLLATSVASSSCASGTTWNGSTCAAPTSLSGTLTPASPSCTIAAGASSCNVTLTWATTNPVGTSSVTSNYPNANTTVATGNSGSTSAAVPYNSRTFYLYNNAQLLATSTASSSCASGTNWNGSTCAASTSMSGTLTPASPSCTIAAGANSCNVTLTWTTANPVGTSSVTSNYPSANTTVATGNSGSTSAAVPYNSRPFFLYNNSQLLATSVASSSCAPGTSWNGSSCQAQACVAPAAPSLSFPIDGSDVTLPLALEWNQALGASSYDVRVGLSAASMTTLTTTNKTNYIVSGLSSGTLYYWTIVARADCGPTTAATSIRTFRTAAVSVVQALHSGVVAPASGTLNQTPFTWSLDATGLSNATVEIVTPDGVSTSFLMSPNGSNTRRTWTYSQTLSASGTFRYRFRDGSLQLPVSGYFSGPVVTTPATCPGMSGFVLLSPHNGASATMPVLLMWSPSSSGSPITYDVFLGAAGTTPLRVASIGATSYQAANLHAGTTYAWRVVAHNDCGNTAETPSSTFIAAQTATSATPPSFSGAPFVTPPSAAAGSKFTWSCDVLNAKQVMLTISDPAGAEHTLVRDVTSTALTNVKFVEELRTEGMHRFRLRAVSADGLAAVMPAAGGTYAGPEVLPAGAAVSVDFDWDPKSPVAGTSVRFTPHISATPSKYAWTFRDGGSSSEASPFHEFKQSNSYDVVLDVTVNGKVWSKTQRVTVAQAQGTLHIKGRVLFDDGTPVVGAPVNLWDYLGSLVPRVLVPSQSGGYFELDVPKADLKYTLTIFDPCVVHHDQCVGVADISTHEAIAIEVRNGAIVSPRASYDFHVNNPVILIHGILSSPDRWDHLVYKLNEVDYPVARVDYEWRSALTPEYLAAHYARPQIGKYLTRVSGSSSPSDWPHFSIIAHSKGGLITRALTTDSAFRNKIDHVVTLSTPNNGALMLWNQLSKVGFLDTRYLQHTFNQAYPAFEAKQVLAVGGTMSCLDFFKPSDTILGIPLVPYESAVTITTENFFGFTTRQTALPARAYKYSHTDFGMAASDDLNDTIITFLNNKYIATNLNWKSVGCYDTVPSFLARSEEEGSNRVPAMVIASASGTLGGPAAMPFDFEGGAGLAVIVDAPGAAVRIVDPNGVDRAGTGESLGDARSYRVADAAAGHWRLELSGSAGDDYAVTVATESAIDVAASLPHALAPAEVFNATFSTDGTVRTDRVTGALFSRSDKIADLAGTNKDGVFTVPVTAPDRGGIYVLSFDISGQRDGVAFQRTISSTLTVRSGRIVFDRVASTSTLDANGNGLTDTVYVDAQIRTTEAGTYVVEAELATTDDSFASHATETVVADAAGTILVPLRFNLAEVPCGASSRLMEIRNVHVADADNGLALGIDDTSAYTAPVSVPVILECGDTTLLAAFTASNEAITSGQTVRFENNTRGAVSGITWEFGDGTTSSEVSPSHVYTIPGNYSVILRVTSATKSDYTTRTISVVPQRRHATGR